MTLRFISFHTVVGRKCILRIVIPGVLANLGASIIDAHSMSAKKEPTAPPWLGGMCFFPSTFDKYAYETDHKSGAAAMAAVVFTHPVDQTKIRSQLRRSRTTMLETARRTVRSSSVLGLWEGLTGSLLRQATYGAARFGIYAELKERDRRAGRKGSLILNGAIAGLVSGIVGAPAG